MAIRNLAAAKDIGLPLLVKASAGGGGIGMRRVDSIDDLEEIVEATQVMAENVFGDRAVFLEKFIPTWSHAIYQLLIILEFLNISRLIIFDICNQLL